MEVAGFTPHKKTTNWDSCAVRNCQSRANRNYNLCFHRFPRPNERFVNKQNALGISEKVDIFKAWQSALKITNVTSQLKVCS